MSFELLLIKLAESGKLEIFKAEDSTEALVIRALAGPSASVCVCVLVGGLSAGAIPDVATIQRRGRLTLTLTTIWHCVLSSVASNGHCVPVKMSVLGQ